MMSNEASGPAAVTAIAKSGVVAIVQTRVVERIIRLSERVTEYTAPGHGVSVRQPGSSDIALGARHVLVNHRGGGQHSESRLVSPRHQRCVRTHKE